ncbi:hypothetical protein BKA82DRAFT_4019289 [Pisolithus tinctorius]|nr:hypothetical protein BKA82DRAFT_4019289 [Pisolithus tinctorius]
MNYMVNMVYGMTAGGYDRNTRRQWGTRVFVTTESIPPAWVLKRLMPPSWQLLRFCGPLGSASRGNLLLDDDNDDDDEDAASTQQQTRTGHATTTAILRAGPSISALAQQQQQQQMLHQPFHIMAPPTQKQTTLFVGSISGGISDDVLNRLLGCV